MRRSDSEDVLFCTSRFLPHATLGRCSLQDLLSWWSPALFGATCKPVLILDHVDLVADAQSRQALLNMICYWHNITFFLVGCKMGNDLQAEVPRALLEYRLEEPTEGA